MKSYKVLDTAAVVLVVGFLSYAGVVFLKPEAVISDTAKTSFHASPAESAGQDRADHRDLAAANFTHLADTVAMDFHVQPSSESDFYVGSPPSHQIGEASQSLPALTAPDRDPFVFSAAASTASTGESSSSGGSSSGGSAASGGGLTPAGTPSASAPAGGGGGGEESVDPDISGIEYLDCDAFAVEFSSGSFRAFIKPSQGTSANWRIDDPALEADVRRNASGIWELEIKAKSSISKVWFPWHPHPLAISQQATDYLLYYPYLLGTASRSDFRKQWEWWGVDYPGTAFAPLMVLASDQEGIAVAAANWPPKKTKVYYSFLRMSFVYEEAIKASQSATFNLIFCKTKSDPSKGVQAWHSGVDVYNRWLAAQMKDEGLLPINYPSWMKEIDGFINIQLENIYDFDISEIYDKWNRWGSFFPWVQFWGQMSGYVGHKGGGCCLEKMDLHTRYIPDLIQFARNITGASGQNARVGYYSRPKEADTDIVGNPSDLNHLLSWLQRNHRDYHANAFYIDVLGARYFGDPLGVATLIRDVFPQDTFIEYPVDIYPTAFLVSGSLGGSQWTEGMWPRNSEEITTGKKTAAFPRFGRYLLRDRILFMGECNGDHVFWGAKGEYWTERQAFLLGIKYDAITIGERDGSSPEMNKALALSISERKRVSWWKREPVYWDTRGLSNISEGVQVRRFKDKDGKNLFVVDNWNLLGNRRFTFNNQTILVPLKRLSILEIN